MSYWNKRLQKQFDKIQKRSEVEITAELARLYLKVQEEIEIEVIKLCEEMEGQDEVSFNTLYNLGRYYTFHNEVNKILNDLGLKEQDIYARNLSKHYQKVEEVIGKEVLNESNSTFGMIDPNAISKIINSVWCADGKNWSDRIWVNKTKMQQTLEDGLTSCVARGMPVLELAKQLKKEVKDSVASSFSMAERLARTELAYVQGQACADRYQKAGVKSYELLSAHDDKACDRCKEMDGKQFKFTEMKVGINYPPLHPNGRCAVIPVLNLPKI